MRVVTFSAASILFVMAIAPASADDDPSISAGKAMYEVGKAAEALMFDHFCGTDSTIYAANHMAEVQRLTGMPEQGVVALVLGETKKKIAHFGNAPDKVVIDACRAWVNASETAHKRGFQ